MTTLRSNVASEETVKAYRHDLELYLDFLSERKVRLSKVRPMPIGDILTYLEGLPGKVTGKKASRGTIERRISAVSSFHQRLLLDSNGRIASPVCRLHRIFQNPYPPALCLSSKQFRNSETA